jgi:hypothetical protein
VPNPKKADPLDSMVARLEEANARAYEQFAREDERSFKSEQDAARSDQQRRPAVPDRRSSRGRAIIGLLLAASVCVAAFAWHSSYGNEAKLIIARWANASLPQPAPLAQTTPQDVAPAAAPMSSELAQWQQTMARELANVEQQIEQLKTGQEQMVRDSTAVAEQLKAALAQMARDNAAVAEQLRASQLAMVEWFWAVGSARKPLRMRKPAPTLPLPRAGAQSQVPVHLLPNQR